jgi:hypothetical protein
MCPPGQHVTGTGTQGRQVVVSWFNAVIWRTEFNDYVEELWGIADAMNMSRLDVFALNCADDIDLYTRSPQGSWFVRRLPHAPTRASLKQVPAAAAAALFAANVARSVPTPCCPALCCGDTTKTPAWTSTCLTPAPPTSSTSPTLTQACATPRAPPPPANHSRSLARLTMPLMQIHVPWSA